MLLFVLIGTAVMFVLALIRRKEYLFTASQSAILTFLLAFSGVIGAKLMFMLESLEWDFSLSGGISFYGSVLLIPVLSILISSAFRIKYLKLLDFYAPMICAMLAVMKLNCLRSGCCGGILLYTSDAGKEIHFPSQIAELLIAFAIMMFLLKFEEKSENGGLSYPIFLLVYGILRFTANFFRKDLVPLVWIIPGGHLWSLVSIIIGAFSFIYIKKRKNDGVPDKQ